MTTAALDVREQNDKKQFDSAVSVTLWIFVALIIIVPIMWIKSCIAPGDMVPDRKDPEILKTCQFVRSCMYDINGDGKLNCIDYSLIFHNNWPTARIIRNVNTFTGMNHLFVSVDGVCIEPQATTMNYTMRDVWGYKYNSMYNEDETEFWERKALTYGY
jgi:hypothetical protein